MNPDTKVIIIANEHALHRICGIRVIERLIRTLARLSIRTIHIVWTSGSTFSLSELQQTPVERSINFSESSMVSEEVTREDIEVILASLTSPDGIKQSSSKLILIDGSYVYDARLLDALIKGPSPTALIDTDLPDALKDFFNIRKGNKRSVWGRAVSIEKLSDLPPECPILNETTWSNRPIHLLDAATVDGYRFGQRRTLRPYFFLVHQSNKIPAVEKFILEIAQNGVLDIPGYLHAPLENAIVRRLWNHRVTPNQVTLLTTLLALIAGLLFFLNQPASALSLALLVGILDGVDGKLARVRVETTPFGQYEHLLDYFYENTWWLVLAVRLYLDQHLKASWIYWGVLVVSDLLDRLAKRYVKNRMGRHLDDLTHFDRWFRLIGGRRNIYVWILCGGFLMRTPGGAYRMMCMWGAITAQIHVVRAGMVGRKMG